MIENVSEIEQYCVNTITICTRKRAYCESLSPVFPINFNQPQQKTGKLLNKTINTRQD